MAFNPKKIRPLFTGIITTAQTYKSDLMTAGGILLDTTRMEGTLNLYQTVVAVGTTVHDVKPGDIVHINLNRYLEVKHTPGVIQDNVQQDNMTAKYSIPKVQLDGVDHLFLQVNDIEYVVEDYDGVEAGGLLQ